MSSDIQYDHEQNDYSEPSNASYTRGNAASRRSANKTRRRVKAPQSVNGLHRRRRKKISW